MFKSFSIGAKWMEQSGCRKSRVRCSWQQEEAEKLVQPIQISSHKFLSGCPRVENHTTNKSEPLVIKEINIRTDNNELSEQKWENKTIKSKQTASACKPTPGALPFGQHVLYLVCNGFSMWSFHGLPKICPLPIRTILCFFVSVWYQSCHRKTNQVSTRNSPVFSPTISKNSIILQPKTNDFSSSHQLI